MRDSLETNNINTIRGILQEDGSTIFAVWGNATLAKVPSALSHIHVRRLLNTLADRIDEAFDESTFDPNDAILRQKLTADANHILQPILDHRGLYWYAVICDDTNNTPDSIMAGEIRVDIFLDPMMVAKRLHLNAIITKTGAAFTEAAIDRSKSAASQASS
jgi:phage tail sheath protein FI